MNALSCGLKNDREVKEGVSTIQKFGAVEEKGLELGTSGGKEKE